jgi:hypothetical protein
MKHYIFYNTVSGKIESNRSCSQKQAIRQCEVNENMAYIEGYVEDINIKKINTDTLAVQDLVVATPSLEDKIRQRRNILLLDCDWTVGPDSPLSDSKKAEWTSYRQALRDITDDITVTTFIELVWPTKPS